MSDRHRKTEQDEKRFGTAAIEKGLINPDDLINGLTIQVKEGIQK